MDIMYTCMIKSILADSECVQYKRDGEEGDSDSASRGNWWEGN